MSKLIGLSNSELLDLSDKFVSVYLSRIIYDKCTYSVNGKKLATF